MAKKKKGVSTSGSMTKSKAKRHPAGKTLMHSEKDDKDFNSFIGRLQTQREARKKKTSKSPYVVNKNYQSWKKQK
tara:strand:- start:1757 stop:1981 length:225 start_codon:yes stop_codon:yes gene_type:complete